MEVRCRTSISGLPKVEGYLEKRGKFNLKCLWKKYWFVLDGRSLLYFKSKDNYEALGVCKGMIDFSRVQTIRIPAKLHHGYPFEIVTRSQIIYLSASDSKTREVWIEELQHAVRPPHISDPFGATKLTAPHVSNLFDNVKIDPNDSKQLESSYSTNPNPNQSSIKIKECENIMHTNLSENEDMKNKFSIEDESSVSNSEKHQNGLLCPDLISECDKRLELKTPIHQKEYFKVKEEQFETQVDESDTNDEYNEESNYETAEETLDEVGSNECLNSIKNDAISAFTSVTHFINYMESNNIISSNEKLEEDNTYCNDNLNITE
ncbi:PH domain-containing protein DDB_G0274775-like [Centruroides vittatus]|uniref:PH domain-containing protein DDB_G0274775-like n=1 Tax=Centruroides vittatus TaxID=120091 RepID=UPI00350F4599